RPCPQLPPSALQFPPGSLYIPTRTPPTRWRNHSHKDPPPQGYLAHKKPPPLGPYSRPMPRAL
ncbi:hypothetical protein T484DRAFT_1925769, partial [Baffinella frigidus]